MRCAYEPSCSPEAATRALKLILPYVYTPGAFYGSQDSMLETQEGWGSIPPLSGNPLNVWSSYLTAFSKNYMAFEERAERSVKMCSNLKVKSRHKLLPIFRTECLISF